MTWAIVVSRLWPWLLLLTRAWTWPLTPMLTIAPSLDMFPAARPDGSTYSPSPTPSRRPSSRAVRLLGAQRVVADHLDGLFQRAGDRHLVVDQAGRRRVRQICVLHDVAPAQLQWVDAQLAGDGVHHLLAADRLHQPRPAVRAAPARVGVDGLRRVPVARDLVRPGEDHPDEPAGVAAGRREGADVLDEVGAGAEDVALGVERRRSSSSGRRGRAGRPSGSRGGPRSTSPAGRAACRRGRRRSRRGS